MAAGAALLLAACQTAGPTAAPTTEAAASADLAPTGSAPAQPSAGPTAQPTPFPSMDPSLGVLHVETDPAVLERDLTLRFLGTAPELAGAPDIVVAAGPPVSVDRALSPGSVGVELDGHACRDSIDILAGMEADATLFVQPQGACSIALEYSHAVGAIHHPITGAIFGAVVFQGAKVVLKRLDPGATQRAIELVAGPTGIEPIEIPLGRYEITATLNGELLKTVEFDYGEVGSDAVMDLMALPPSTPRDCGDLDLSTCEAAITAAMSYGLWISPDDVVTSAKIVQSSVRDCDPAIEGPFIDVHFEIAPDGEVDPTVGHGSDSGALQVCPAY